MIEHLFLGDSTYPHQSLVSELRSFGATVAELRAADRIEQLERELEEAQKDASRYAWAASNPLYFMHLCHGSQAIDNDIDECIAEDKA